MTDYAALLRAVLEDPADDAPRLVLADWLDDHGEPERAEFVRVQCKLAAWDCTFKQTKEQPGWKHNCGTDDKGYWLCQPIRSRERALLSEPRHFVNWTPALLHTGPGAGIRADDLDPVVHLTGKGFQSATFARGFIESVSLPTAAFLAHAAALFAAHPITAVRLTDREPVSRRPDSFVWQREREFRQAWRGLRNPDYLTRYDVPDDIFQLMADENARVGEVMVSYKVLTSAEAAHAALSAACVAFGRDAVGLPDLTPEPARV